MLSPSLGGSQTTQEIRVMDISFHYPPELLNLLIDAVPKLCKSKKDLLQFLQGAGIDREVLAPYESLLLTNKSAFNKYPVTREVLTKLNEKGEASLRERREILKRVTHFDDFSVCWESDQAAARGLVAQIRELVNVKDSFTRMNQERERERQERLEASHRAAKEHSKRKADLEEIRRRFFALFSESNPYKRGKAAEAVLNQYFAYGKILISEAVTVKGESGAGIVEQIDGVIQLRGQLFLVELKWEQETLGREKVAFHLVRIFSRGLAGGIIISYSDYSPASITDCKEALREKVVILCKVQEIVQAIDLDSDIKKMLEAKIDAAVIHKNPLFIPST
jgi:restriction system protein